jgi:preprotein translocase subunit SecF
MEKQKIIEIWDKNYKKFLIIPVILVLLSLAYMGYFYQQNGDFLRRDVSLTGGTSITLKTDIGVEQLKAKLLEFPDIDIKSLADNTGKQTHLLITVPAEKDKIVSAIEQALNIKITEDNSSIEYTGGNLGKDFYNQLLTAMFFAFLLMALVVFITFGESKILKIYSSLLTLIALKLTFPIVSTISLISGFLIAAVFFYGLYAGKGREKLIVSGIFLVGILVFFFPYYLFIFLIAIICLGIYTLYSAPSIAVITCAFADIIFTVATINLMGMWVSSAGIVAFLMLIGYSIDTDILLTTRVLKRKHDSVNHATFGAFKTGITMTLTAIASVLVGLFMVYRYGTVLNQIFIILCIGLFYDIFNTWLTNVWIIKWYAESKEHAHKDKDASWLLNHISRIRKKFSKSENKSEEKNLT